MIASKFTLLLLIPLLLHAKPPPSIERQLVLPETETSYTYIFEAAVTYWASYTEGLNIAFSEGTEDLKGNTITPRKEAWPGFKVAIGANTFYDNIHAKMCLTWFNNPAPLKENPLIEELVYESPFDGALEVSSISSKYLNDFTRLDAALYKQISLSNRVFITPWFGALGAWDFENLTFPLTTSEDTSQYNKFIQNWWGAGPYSGVKTDLYVLKNYGFTASTGASILLCSSRIRVQQNLTEGEEERGSVNTVTKPWDVEPMVETLLGIFASYPLDEWSIEFVVAWELQTYFSHLSYPKYYSPLGLSGNYSMQGLTATVHLNF